MPVVKNPVANSIGATSVAVTASALSAVEADLLVIPWFEGEAASAVGGVDGATGGEVARAIASREFPAKPYEMFFTPITGSGWKASRIALVGGGRRSEERRVGKGGGSWES